MSPAAISVAGFGYAYAGCSSLVDTGYQKAEVDRLEDVAQQNAEATAKLCDDVASARGTGRGWGKTADDVEAGSSMHARMRLLAVAAIAVVLAGCAPVTKIERVPCLPARLGVSCPEAPEPEPGDTWDCPGAVRMAPAAGA